MKMRIEEQQIPLLIKEGKDKDVISHLYKTIFPKVKKYIINNNGIAEDARDVFQDSLLYFYNQVVDGSYNDKYTVYGYLFRLSINRWLNKLKQNKKIRLTPTLDENEFGGYLEAEFQEISLLQEDENMLEKLFSGIGEKCVELLTYTIYYNLMAEDIMIRMGFGSEGAVKMQMKRCKEKLYIEIENNPSILNKLKGI